MDMIEERLDVRSTSEIPGTQVVVSRLSEDTNDGHEHALIRTGFQTFRDFMTSLADKYPERAYPTKEVLDNWDPAQTGNRTITYTATSDEGLVVGVYMGDEDEGEFKSDWLVVDPAFQNRGIARRLVQAGQNNYDIISGTAEVFGYERGLSAEELQRRQDSLVAYYQRLGFQVDTSSKMYKVLANRQMVNKPIPIIWKREDSKSTA